MFPIQFTEYGQLAGFARNAIANNSLICGKGWRAAFLPCLKV